MKTIKQTEKNKITRYQNLVFKAFNIYNIVNTYQKDVKTSYLENFCDFENKVYSDFVNYLKIENRMCLDMESKNKIEIRDKYNEYNVYAYAIDKFPTTYKNIQNKIIEYFYSSKDEYLQEIYQYIDLETFAPFVFIYVRNSSIQSIQTEELLQDKLQFHNYIKQYLEDWIDGTGEKSDKEIDNYIDNFMIYLGNNLEDFKNIYEKETKSIKRKYELEDFAKDFNSYIKRRRNGDRLLEKNIIFDRFLYKNLPLKDIVNNCEDYVAVFSYSAETLQLVRRMEIHKFKDYNSDVVNCIRMDFKEKLYDPICKIIIDAFKLNDKDTIPFNMEKLIFWILVLIERNSWSSAKNIIIGLTDFLYTHYEDCDKSLYESLSYEIRAAQVNLEPYKNPDELVSQYKYIVSGIFYDIIPIANNYINIIGYYDNLSRLKIENEWEGTK